jgi:hypothetical protein
LRECLESYKLEQSDRKAKKSVKTDFPKNMESTNKDEEVDIVEEPTEEEDDKQVCLLGVHYIKHYL